MTIYQALKYYLKSNTNIAVSASAIIAIALSLLLQASILIPILFCVAYLGLTAALIVSKRGAAEIVREREEEIEETALEKMARADAVRKRIEVIRIPDAEVSKALQHYLLVSATLLESAAKEDRYLPKAVENIEQVLSACTSYLVDLDDHSTAQRYDRSPEKSKTDLVSDTTEFIRGATNRLDELRRIELPDPDDLDKLMEIEPPDGKDG